MRYTRSETHSKKNAGTLILLALMAASFLQACGEGGFQSATWRETQDLPEPHGPMNFERSMDDTPVTEQIPSTPQTPVQGNIAVDGGSDGGADKTPPRTPVQPESSPEDDSSSQSLICQDAHRPNIQLPDGLVCPSCFKGEYKQKTPSRAKLDILFVADTSPSLATERGAIAAGIGDFIKQLPPDTDYRIAVMAAHSDYSYDPAVKSSSGLAGKLITYGKEPAVLRKDNFGGNMDRLAKALSQRLMEMRSEGASDGGELGLFSLDRGITRKKDGGLLEANQELGFFRGDAALAVIFISDENDLCALGRYPPGVTPAENKNMYGNISVEEKASQFYCRGGNGKPHVTDESVYTKLRNLKKIPADAGNGISAEANQSIAHPLLVTGIHYKSPQSVPTAPAPDEKFPEYFHENEMGYGYLDLISRANARSIDVAVDISVYTHGASNDPAIRAKQKAGLARIGEAARLKLEVKDTHKLSQGKDIDENTLCVLVDGKEVPQLTSFDTKVDGMSYVYVPQNREVQLRGIGPTNASGEASMVEAFYCESPEVLFVPPEVAVDGRKPTRAEHYRSVLGTFPAACKTVRERIQSGSLD